MGQLYVWAGGLVPVPGTSFPKYIKKGPFQLGLVLHLSFGFKINGSGKLD